MVQCIECEGELQTEAAATPESVQRLFDQEAAWNYYGFLISDFIYILENDGYFLSEI